MKQLAVVIPVLNERLNIIPLMEALQPALDGIDWEVIFVDDDSTDGTSETITELARTDPRIRLIHRIGRTGLASACVEGMLATTADSIAVMDGDLQHDEMLLPAMWRKLQTGQLDLVNASRNLGGGSMGEFSAKRVRLSHLGRFLAGLVAPKTLTDPMSGFFIVSRSYFLEVVRRLSQLGFKILLDLVASSPRPLRFAELPYRFRNRAYGESKLTLVAGTDLILLVTDKLTRQWLPVRYAVYGVVGLLGIVVHLSVLTLLLHRQVDLTAAQAVATFAAVVCNFWLNNRITYADRKLTGARKVALGFVIYAAGCSLGALANVSLTRLLADARVPELAAASVGMLVSSVWNYAIASVFAWGLWRRRRGRRRPTRPPANLAVSPSAASGRRR